MQKPYAHYDYSDMLVSKRGLKAARAAGSSLVAAVVCEALSVSLICILITKHDLDNNTFL